MPFQEVTPTKTQPSRAAKGALVSAAAVKLVDGRPYTRIFLKNAVVKQWLGEQPINPVRLSIALGDGADTGKVRISRTPDDRKAAISLRRHTATEFVVQSILIPNGKQVRNRAGCDYTLADGYLTVTLPWPDIARSEPAKGSSGGTTLIPPPTSPPEEDEIKL